MKKYYLIRVKREKLQYIVKRFPVAAWLRIDASAIRRKAVMAALAALLGCAPLRRTHEEVVIRREDVIAAETLRLTTTLHDTLYLRNERVIVKYDTLKNVLRIEQVRPVVLRRDSVVIERLQRLLDAPASQPSWWVRWGRWGAILGFIASLFAFIVYLWLRALRIG